MLKIKIISNLLEVGLKKSRFKFLGIVPILFFFFTLFIYIVQDQIYQILWVCNISNLVLGISIMMTYSTLIWISTLWIVLGTPLWVVQDLINYSTLEMSGILTHFGSSLIGLTAIKHFPKTGTFWKKALIYFLFIQIFSRIITSPIDNINVSFSPYKFYFSQVFSHYWTFWFVGLMVIGGVLFLLERFFERFLIGGNNG